MVCNSVTKESRISELETSPRDSGSKMLETLKGWECDLNIIFSGSWYSHRLYNHYHYLIPEHSHTPKRNLTAPATNHPFSLASASGRQAHFYPYIAARGSKLKRCSKHLIRMVEGQRRIRLVRSFPLEFWLAPPLTQQETDVAC